MSQSVLVQDVRLPELSSGGAGSSQALPLPPRLSTNWRHPHGSALQLGLVKPAMQMKRKRSTVQWVSVPVVQTVEIRSSTLGLSPHMPIGEGRLTLLTSFVPGAYPGKGQGSVTSCFGGCLFHTVPVVPPSFPTLVCTPRRQQ